jgi:hypothetical protein
MSIHEIPIVYKDNDTIYHYTTSVTTLTHILMSKKLRLSPRSQSSDPIENAEHFFSYSTSNRDREHSTNATRLTNEAREILRKTKQVSFCKNNSLEHEPGMIYPPFEKYGFAKPRMWDQYGDRYKGVCLAFSLKKILEAVKSTEVIGDDLKYITYHQSEVGHRSIDLDQLSRDGYDTYKRVYFDYLIKRLFNKYKDYIHENEFRLCSFADGNYDYIDIKDALRGVIISDLSVNPFLYKGFEDILAGYTNIDIQILSFSNQTLRIGSYERHKKLVTEIENELKGLAS